MGRPRRGIGAELLAVTLIGGCLAGTLVVVVSIHRRQPIRRPTAPAVILPMPAPEVASAPGPLPPPPPPAPPPPVDPTGKIVAELATAEAEQRAEAEKAAHRIAALETATRAARAEADRWKRNLSLTRAQLDAREAQADRREGDAQMVAFERDALARRRDLLQKALERDRERPSYAVLPHRGPNGTWQRPIVIECKGEGVTLRPVGKSFDLMEITSPFGLGGNSFLGAVAREAVRIQRQTAPDGFEIVPYIFFIVRPDGIRSYYEARSRLERIGIAFGYELADAEWAIDVPDLDNPATWDGSPPPLNLDGVASDPSGPRGAAGGSSGRGGAIDGAFIWPKAPSGTADEGGLRGGVGLATPGTGDGTYPRTTNRPGGGSDGFGPTGSGGLSPDRMSGAVGRRAAGGGLGEGSPSSGDQSDGVRGGGDGAAWGRLHEGYDPRRPVGLAPLARGDGAGTAPGGMSGRYPRGDGLGSDDGRGEGTAAGGGASIPGDDLGSPGSLGNGVPGFPGGPGAGGRDGQGEGHVALPGSGGAAGGSAGSGGTGAAGQAGGQPGGTGSQAGSQGRPGEGAGSGASGAAGQAGGQPGGTGRQGTTGEGQAGSPGGDAFGQAGGGEGIKSPLGGLGMTSRPIEMVLVCGPKGVAVYPGDYRVTKATLKEKDELLVAQLRAIVRRREEAQPGHLLRPSIRYVVEPGGRETYAMARGQLALSGLGWSTSTQISGSDVFRLFSTDEW